MSDFEKERELGISPNVYGVETEYSCMAVLPGNVVYEYVGTCHSVDAKLGLYREPGQKGTSGLDHRVLADQLSRQGITRTDYGGMLSNGGRFYVDPSGPEYCTPETRTAEEAVMRSIDGDRIVLDVFKGLRQDGVLDSFQLNHRVVDHNRTSRGIHLNTVTNLGVDPDRSGDVPVKKDVVQHLAALNVAKGAIFGSGGLLIDEKGNTAFHSSPRLSVTNELSREYSSYRRRPLVRVPFKRDGEDLARIETVTGDALTFPWPLKASMVMTNTTVKMLEMGVRHLPVMTDPVRAAHIVGRFGNRNMISLIDNDGEKEGVRPLDVIRMICEKALELDEHIEFLDEESTETLDEIIETADAMTADPMSVASRVESVARWIAIKRKMETDGRFALDSEKICRTDYYWDMIDGGIAERLRDGNKAGWHGFGRVDDKAAAKRRRLEPPQDTRAKIRGKAIMIDGEQNKSSWENIQLPGSTPDYFHPYEFQEVY